MSQANKLLFPGIITALGLVLLSIGFKTEQNGYFLFSAAVVLIIGLVLFMAINNIFNKTIRAILFVVFLSFSAMLAFYDYNSIQVPLEFEKVKEKRYSAVVQRLKDIREAQKGYKTKYGNYASTFDTLITFIKYDSIPIVKAIGDRPDTLTESQAIEMGIMKRDTILISAKEKIYSENYLATRNPNVELAVDSFEYIPYGHGAKFEMQVGEVEKNNLMVNTLWVMAPNKVIFPDWNKNLYLDEPDRQFGSTSDPSISGNWE